MVLHNKRLWLISVLIAITLGLVTACQATDDPKKADDPKKTEEKNNKAQEELQKILTEQVELVIYIPSNETEESFLNNYGGAQMKKKFPNYTFKLLSRTNAMLPELFVNKQPIDIVIATVISTTSELMEYNLQSDISDLITKYNYDLDRLEPNVIAVQRGFADGGIFGLPFKNNSQNLFYNKDLFDRFAVPHPKDGMTWDELYDTARIMTRVENGVQYQGLTTSFSQVMLLNQLSAPFFDKNHKAVFTGDQFVRAFENIARFYKISGNEYPNQSYNTSQQVNAFEKDQTAAMIINLRNMSVRIGDSFNWDLTQLPFFPEAIGTGQQVYPEYFYITNISQHRDAAFQVLSFIASDEFQSWQARMGFLPIVKDATKMMETFGIDEPAFKGKNVKSFLPTKYAAPIIQSKFQSIATREVTKALNDYVAGNDVITALREAAERTDKAVETELQK